MERWSPPAGEPYPTSPEGFPPRGVNSLAPMSARWMARIIDLTLICVPVLTVSLVVTVLATSGDPTPDAEAVRLANVWTWGAAIAVLIVYDTICVTLWGQTAGKAAFGIRVARQANGRSPVWWEAALRISLLGVVAVIPHPVARVAAIGLFAVASFDPMVRGVHDRAAGTVVVRSRPPRRDGPGTVSRS